MRSTFLMTTFLSAAGWLHAQEPHELRLGEVIGAALSRGPLVEAARARVRAAEGARSSARALPNPILTWQVENARFPGSTAPSVDRETSTFANLPLEFLFQRGPQVRRAEQSLRAAEADLAAARWLVALDAARAFAQVLTAQAALTAAGDLRAGLADLNTFNQARVAEGVTPEGDLIRVRVERDRATLEEAMAEAELARAWAELRLFVPTLVAAAPLPRLVVSPPPVSTVPALAALVQRSRQSQPEILAARARVDASRAEAAFQRRLSVRQVGLAFGNKRVAGQNTMIAGLSLSVPLFNRNRGEIARADAERDAAEQELAWTERRVAARVEAAHRAAEVMTSRLNSLAPDLLERAEESRRIALAAYREGAGSLLQVLDASRALADVRQTYGRALLAGEQSLLELRATSGEDPLEGPTDTAFEGGHR